MMLLWVRRAERQLGRKSTAYGLLGQITTCRNFLHLRGSFHVEGWSPKNAFMSKIFTSPVLAWTRSQVRMGWPTKGPDKGQKQEHAILRHKSLRSAMYKNGMEAPIQGPTTESHGGLKDLACLQCIGAERNILWEGQGGAGVRAEGPSMPSSRTDSQILQ